MMNKREIFKKIAQILKNERAKRIAIFGSYARGEEKPESDIDIIDRIRREMKVIYG